MSVVFRQATYLVPGIYQWVKPSTAAGVGPFGSTYLETIITVVGPGSGGGSGSISNNQGASVDGSPGGNGGGFGQATYLPAALSLVENIVVAKGSPGGLPVTNSGLTISFTSGNAGLSVNGTASSFGTHISCAGGFGTANQNGGMATIVGGSNVTNLRGGSQLTALNNVVVQLMVGPGVNIGAQPSWTLQGNNAGAAGGSCNSILSGQNRAGIGGGVFPSQFGGTGVVNSTGNAKNGTSPGDGGGASYSVGLLFPLTAGSGVNAPPNSGAGGGGGGSVTSLASATGGPLTSGAGGNGSNGVVQVTDIFTLPPALPVNYFNWDLVTWFHMLNMSRPISLTGRYQS